MADELETCAFAKLGEMKVVRYLALRPWTVGAYLQY